MCFNEKLSYRDVFKNSRPDSEVIENNKNLEDKNCLKEFKDHNIEELEKVEVNHNTKEQITTKKRCNIKIRKGYICWSS